MNKVWLVWASNDETEPLLLGVATNKDKANQMVSEMCRVFDDTYEYHIYGMNTNTLTINNKEVEF